MSVCEVLVNFKVGNFELLSKRLPLNEFIIFTDDVSIKQRGKELGYKIEWIEEFFGFANDKIYSIYDKSIERANLLTKWFSDITCKDVSLINGLRFDLINRFVFLEEIKMILETKQNCLFLFSYPHYQSFTILDLATSYDYKTTFGISEIVKSDLVPIDFKKRVAKDFGFFYQAKTDLISLHEDNINKFVKKKVDEFNDVQSVVHAFFLTDNSWKLYLNPIFPVLEQFRARNTPFIIFTLDVESTTHLQERGYRVHNLTPTLQELLYKVLSRIPPLNKKEQEMLRENIDAKYKKSVNEINEKIVKLEYDLGIRKKEETHFVKKKPRLDKREEIVRKESFEEKLYYKLLNVYSNYSRHTMVLIIGKVAKPVFVKIEHHVQEKRKQRELVLKREIEKMKKLQLEKELVLKREIEKMKKLQLEKELVLKREIEEMKKLQLEKELDLINKKRQLLEIELQKENEITKELGRVLMTPLQKILAGFLGRIKTFSSDDVIIQCFNKYLSNDTNVLYLARIIGAIVLFDHIFKKFKFRSVLVSSGGSPDIDLVCNVAKNHHVPNYLMTIHPYEEHNPLDKVMLNAEKLLVAGDRLKEELQNIGFDKNRLIVTGNPKFDRLNKTVINEKYHTQYNALTNKERPLVVVANSRWNDNDDEWMSKLIRYCNDKNLRILIKVHPTYRKWKKELNNEMIRGIEKKCVGLEYDIQLDVDLLEILPKTDVLITEFSWTGFEGSLCDVPLIVTNFYNKEYSSHALLYHKENIALYAATLEDLFNCLDTILYDTNAKNKFQEARKKLNYDFNYLNDGKAAERVYQILTQHQ